MASGEEHSELQLKAGEAQARADRTGRGKEAAAALQSEADRRAKRKHGQ